MRTGDGIILEGQMVGLRRGPKILILRSRTGEIVQGCEKVVACILAGKPFTLSPGDAPDEIIEAIKQVVLPADQLCNGDGTFGGGVTVSDRP